MKFTTQRLCRFRSKRIPADSLTSFRSADLYNDLPGWFIAEVVVVTDHPVHLGAR